MALPLLLGACSGPSLAPERSARVERVVDGDTVVLTGIGKTRLIGVDTPEVYRGAECYGPEASQFAKRILRPGRPVGVRVGVARRDRYGRVLAYLFLSERRTFNEDLVAGGYARPLTMAPNDDLAGRFDDVARRARIARRGLWGSCPRSRP